MVCVPSKVILVTYQLLTEDDRIIPTLQCKPKQPRGVKSLYVFGQGFRVLPVALQELSEVHIPSNIPVNPVLKYII